MAFWKRGVREVSDQLNHLTAGLILNRMAAYALEGKPLRVRYSVRHEDEPLGTVRVVFEMVVPEGD